MEYICCGKHFLLLLLILCKRKAWKFIVNDKTWPRRTFALHLILNFKCVLAKNIKMMHLNWNRISNPNEIRFPKERFFLRLGTIVDLVSLCFQNSTVLMTFDLKYSLETGFVSHFPDFYRRQIGFVHCNSFYIPPSWQQKHKLRKEVQLNHANRFRWYNNNNNTGIKKLQINKERSHLSCFFDWKAIKVTKTYKNLESDDIKIAHTNQNQKNCFRCVKMKSGESFFSSVLQSEKQCQTIVIKMVWIFPMVLCGSGCLSVKESNNFVLLSMQKSLFAAHEIGIENLLETPILSCHFLYWIFAMFYSLSSPYAGINIHGTLFMLCGASFVTEFFSRVLNIYLAFACQTKCFSTFMCIIAAVR